MAVPIRGIERGPGLLPVSVSGWIALGLFGLSILLLLGRLVLARALQPIEALAARGAVESDAVPKILVFGPWRLVKHPPRGKAVAHATS